MAAGMVMWTTAVVPPATPPPNSTLLSTNFTKSSRLTERERNKEI